MHPTFPIELLIALAIAVLGLAAFERLRLPSIAGFLVAGALLGPGGLGFVSNTDSVRPLAELGVVLLLFEIGIELPLDAVRRSWRAVLIAGSLQIAGTIALVAAGAIWLGVAPPAALVLGAVAAISCTSLVIRTLGERGELDAPHGHLAVGILVFQDLCVIPLALALPILAGEVALELGPIARRLGGSALALLALVAIARFALPLFLERLLVSRSRDLVSLIAFVLVLGAAAAAQMLGLTLGIGAFCAGLALGTSPYAHALRAELVPLRGVLLALFFIALGMLVDGEAVFRLAPQIALFALAVAGLKIPLVFTILVGLLHRSRGVALRTAFALAQTGEFSFVLADLAHGGGLLSTDALQVIIAGSIPTLIATPFLLQWSAKLGPVTGRSRSALAHASDAPRSEHVIVVGYGLTGRTLVGALRAAQVPYSIVDANPELVKIARRAGVPAVLGDASSPDRLRDLHAAHARLLVVAISDPAATQASVAAARSISAELPVLVRTRYVAQIDELRALGATRVIAEELEATLDILDAALRTLGISGDALERVAEELRAESYAALRGARRPSFGTLLSAVEREADTHWIDVRSDGAVGRTLAELDLRAVTGASIVALERAGLLVPNPGANSRLQGGDRVLALGDGEALDRLSIALAGEPLAR